MIQAFVHFIAHRIALGISDADSDVEHNFGMCHGKLMQLDPGRWLLCDDLNDPLWRSQEWWRATHRLRKWLEAQHPQAALFLDEAITSCAAQAVREPETKVPW